MNPKEENPGKKTVVEEDDVKVEQPKDEEPEEGNREKTEKPTEKSLVDDVNQCDRSRTRKVQLLSNSKNLWSLRKQLMKHSG